MLRKEAGLEKAEECKYPEACIYGDEGSEPKMLRSGERISPGFASGVPAGVRAGRTIARGEPEA
jgi:hypothetical protein